MTDAITNAVASFENVSNSFSILKDNLLVDQTEMIYPRLNRIKIARRKLWKSFESDVYSQKRN